MTDPIGLVLRIVLLAVLVSIRLGQRRGRRWLDEMERRLDALEAAEDPLNPRR